MGSSSALLYDRFSGEFAELDPDALAYDSRHQLAQLQQIGALVRRIQGVALPLFSRSSRPRAVRYPSDRDCSVGSSGCCLRRTQGAPAADRVGVEAVNGDSRVRLGWQGRPISLGQLDGSQDADPLGDFHQPAAMAPSAGL